MEEAVDSALNKLGVDTKNPEFMHADLTHLREWRETMQLVRRKGIVAVVLSIITFLMTAVAVGIGVLTTGKIPGVN
jgi:hypothetical protein